MLKLGKTEKYLIKFFDLNPSVPTKYLKYFSVANNNKTNEKVPYSSLRSLMRKGLIKKTIDKNNGDFSYSLTKKGRAISIKLNPHLYIKK